MARHTHNDSQHCPHPGGRAGLEVCWSVRIVCLHAVPCLLLVLSLLHSLCPQSGNELHARLLQLGRWRLSGRRSSFPKIWQESLGCVCGGGRGDIISVAARANARL